MTFRIMGTWYSQHAIFDAEVSSQEAVKEVQGVKPGREEQIDYPIQLNIESKTVSIVQQILNVIPEAEETAATFKPLSPFSKLIGKGETQIDEEISKSR